MESNLTTWKKISLIFYNDNDFKRSSKNKSTGEILKHLLSPKKKKFIDLMHAAFIVYQKVKKKVNKKTNKK